MTFPDLLLLLGSLFHVFSWCQSPATVSPHGWSMLDLNVPGRKCGCLLRKHWRGGNDCPPIDLFEPYHIPPIQQQRSVCVYFYFLDNHRQQSKWLCAIFEQSNTSKSIGINCTEIASFHCFVFYLIWWRSLTHPSQWGSSAGISFLNLPQRR